MLVKSLKKASAPSRLIFFDSETFPEQVDAAPTYQRHRLRLGCATAGRWREGKLTCRKSLDFFDCKTFLAWVESLCAPRETTWIVAHNAGFDCQVCGIFDAIKQRRFIIADNRHDPNDGLGSQLWAEPCGKSIIIGDPPTIIKVELQNGAKLQIIDSLNYVRSPLARLGEAIGKPKLDFPDWYDPESIWLDYCRRDVEILEEWFCGLLRWIKDNDLGPVKTTSSAQAMAAYRYRFLRHEIRSHTIDTVRELEREAYFGGEFKVFRLGRFAEPITQLDVNSLFPAVMAEHDYPANLARWNWDDDWHTWPGPFTPSESIAEVWLHADDDDYPVRIDADAVHCRGFFRTVLAGPDLARASRQGHVVAYRRWATYQFEDLFSGWVKHIYDLRLRSIAEGRLDRSGFAKLLLNGLYGKWGQMGSNLVYRPEVNLPIEWGKYYWIDRKSGETREFYCLGGEVYERVQRGELRGSCPVISLWIAAHARNRMRQLRTLAIRSDLLYQGVDSLILRGSREKPFLDAGLVDPHALGKLKIEAKADGCAIHGHGWYEIGDRICLPGKKRTVPIEDGKGYWQTKFEGIRSNIWTEPGPIVWTRKTFHRLPASQVRGVADSEGFIEPWYLEHDPKEWGLDWLGRL